MLQKLDNQHKKVQTLRSVMPQTKIMTLPPDNLMLEITCYNFFSMLLALLSSIALWNHLSDLVVNPSKSFVRYVVNTGRLDKDSSDFWY